MKNLIIAVLAGVGASGCGQNQDVTAPSPASVSIHGRVEDFRSQTGLAGAVVQFSPQEQSGAIRATTDGSGAYQMSVSSATAFTISVDGSLVGTARVTGPRYRGDLLIDRGTCISRYGTVADSRTLRPVGGATVAIGNNKVTSGPDGWYRIDLGCPSTPGFPSTVVISVTHPNFADYQGIIGRGIEGVRRIDIHFERP